MDKIVVSQPIHQALSTYQMGTITTLNGTKRAHESSDLEKDLPPNITLGEKQVNL